MARVIIADDHPIVREGLKKILERTSDIEVTDEASSGEELLDKISHSDCDVVLLDLTMHGMNGLEILEQLKAQRPKLPVLVISMHSEEHYAVRVLKMGASGYLSKDKAPEELIGAIRKTVAGGKYVSPYLAEKMAFDLETGQGEIPHETLSNREFQVMCLIASGKTVSEIALQMALSARTVSTYRSRLLEKMKMKNNAEITHYAIAKGLVDGV